MKIKFAPELRELKRSHSLSVCPEELTFIFIHTALKITKKVRLYRSEGVKLSRREPGGTEAVKL